MDRLASDYISYVAEHRGLIVNIANRYIDECHGQIDLDDLIQEGFIGLMIAVDKFDPNKEIKFSTFAWQWIRQRIHRYVQDNRGPVRISNWAQDAGYLVRKAKRYFNTLGVECSIKDIAQFTGLSEKTVAFILELKKETPDEIVKPDSFSTSIDLDEIDRSMLLDKFLSCLSSIEKTVVRMMFGVGGDMISPENIAKILNLKTKSIWAIKCRAVRKLRDAAQYNPQTGDWEWLPPDTPHTSSKPLDK